MSKKADWELRRLKAETQLLELRYERFKKEMDNTADGLSKEELAKFILKTVYDAIRSNGKLRSEIISKIKAVE